MDIADLTQRDAAVAELVRSSQSQIRLGRGGAPTIVAVGLIALGLYVILPLTPPILVGAWVAGLARPLVPFLMRGLGKEAAASVVTTALVLSVLIPAATLGLTISSAAIDMWRALLASSSVQDGLTMLAQPGAVASVNSREQLMALANQYGSSTLAFASGLLGAAGQGALQLFILVLSTYAFLAYDRRFYTFCLLRLPIAPIHVERLRLAFHETGRGLLIGTGMTCLVQASIGTIIYLALGVPRALVLGGITFVAAFVPGIGTALVWLPVAIGLALTGHLIKATIMMLMGVLVIGTIDNFLRPWIAQRTSLALPPLVMLLGMLGGMAALGGWGLLLGPLVFRLALEALEILREQSELVTQVVTTPEPPTT